MTDLKFVILTEIYNAAPRASINKATFLQSKGEDFPKYGRAIWELRDAGYLRDIGGHLEMTAPGIAAMEEEELRRKHREEDVKLQRELAADAARGAKRARLQQWVTGVFSCLKSLSPYLKFAFEILAKWC